MTLKGGVNAKIKCYIIFCVGFMLRGRFSSVYCAFLLLHSCIKCYENAIKALSTISKVAFLLISWLNPAKFPLLKVYKLCVHYHFKWMNELTQIFQVKSD